MSPPDRGGRRCSGSGPRFTKTWNDALKLLRATFKHLHPHLNDGSNPFHGLVTKATETINREPFTVEELKAITESCAGDDFIRPIIVTGMCTAMPRGDCCLLKWDDVDLGAGFITVKTAKTGETVDIPMLPMLRKELERARAPAARGTASRRRRRCTARTRTGSPGG